MGMNKKAILLGYGGTGRELACWLSEIGYDNISYLDDFLANKDVLGKIEQWPNYSNHKFFATIGSYKSMARRKSILELIPDDNFGTAISPKAAVYSDKIGKGCLIFPFSVIGASVRIGGYCLLYHSCVISHDSKVADNCIVSNGAVVSGGVTIGENTYIGANSTILEGISIGSNCIVAAGATVVEDVPSDSIYYGPKKIVGNKYFTYL